MREGLGSVCHLLGQQAARIGPSRRYHCHTNRGSVNLRNVRHNFSNSGSRVLDHFFFFALFHTHSNTRCMSDVDEFIFGWMEWLRRIADGELGDLGGLAGLCFWCRFGPFCFDRRFRADDWRLFNTVCCIELCMRVCIFQHHRTTGQRGIAPRWCWPSQELHHHSLAGFASLINDENVCELACWPALCSND